MSFMIICAILSFCILVGFGVYILRKKPQRRRHEQLLTDLQLWILAMFLAAAVLFLGIYGFGVTEDFSLASRSGWHNFPHSALLSLHTAIRLFVVDSNFEIVLEAADNGLPPESFGHFLYVFYAALLYLAAPILTFSFVMSFFHDVRSSFFYGLRTWTRHQDAYIFSELSEKSLSLAESIDEKAEKRPLIVFTNVSKEDDVDSCLIQQRIKKLKALTFHKGMLHVGFNSHNTKNTIAFFVLGEKEPENIRIGLELIKEYGDRPLTELYVLASSASAELMLNSANRVRPQTSENAPERITIRCINSVRSLIYQTLYDMELERLPSPAAPPGSFRVRPAP